MGRRECLRRLLFCMIECYNMAMAEKVLSAGIDIGTTTTQVIFSELTVENTGGFGMAPKIEVTEKKIVYRGDIHFTPLSSRDRIDAAGAADIIKEEYERAKINPKDVACGAVIVTGETSRKRNAREIAERIAAYAGDFVVASAGPDLESTLAGYGSGAAAISENENKIVANLDIGGGTTNIAYFDNGKLIDTACIDIGGRLIKVSENRVEYISGKMRRLLEYCKIELKEGDILTKQTAEKAVSSMVHVLEEAVGLREKSSLLDMMITNRGITVSELPAVFTFSGGVADCIKKEYGDFEFGDIGVLLGLALRKSLFFTDACAVRDAYETIRATVIGAGNFSMELSGSTVEYRNIAFPVKNLPAVRVPCETAEDIVVLKDKIIALCMRYMSSQEDFRLPAVCFKGIKSPAYADVLKIAGALSDASQALARHGAAVFVIEEDIAKALGKAYGKLTNRPFLFVDGISAKEGDYIDFAMPLYGGKVIPVTVKTLLFGN